jgi:hypothetical protein
MKSITFYVIFQVKSIIKHDITTIKNLIIMKKTLLILLVTLGFYSLSLSQVLYEEFNYTPPAYIGGNGNAGSTSNNWTTHSVTSGQTTTIDIISGNLTYPGLPASSGYKVSMFGNANATSRDVNRAIISTDNVLYYSVLINVVDNSGITVTGDYFMHFGAASGTTVTTFGGRLGAKQVNTGANYRFMIQNISGGTPNFTEFPEDLTFGTTYLVVVKYDKSTSPTTASLWVNPSSLGGAEPTGSVSNTSGTGTFSTFASICLRNNATTPKVEIDEIRIGATWADVTPTGTIAAPTIQASNITFDNILQTQMDVAWTNGNGAKRVVKINTVNSFTAPVDGTDPTANPVYGGSGQQVVYNGSDNTIPTVSGLTAGATYWFKVYEYNGTGTGTLYCSATGTNNPKSQATAAGAVAPIIIEPTFSDVTATSAILGGNITSNGGAAITQRGTVWSLTSPVTINDNKLAEGGTTVGVFSHLRSSMPSDTTIYFAAYATNSAGTSMTDESSFTTLLGEPTNHAANFMAVSTTYSSITVTWLDNDGTQPATGFLIKANTTGIFWDPVDGMPAVYDPTIGVDSGAVTVNHGNQIFTWYSLTSSTPYYFKIYPYTNTGTNIDYKLTPTAPTATVTTQAYVAPLAAWTFDETPANPNTPTSVVANIGFQAGTAMLYADGTNGSSLWNQATELNTFGGTLINDPREGGTALAGVSYCPLGGTGNSANGKSMIIKFSMEDYINPVLTFATRGTATGFTTHQWAWSTDNVTFTDFGSNTCNSTSSFLARTIDMSDINDLDQAVDVYLRVTFTGATSASGNNRLDNIVISASEPSSGPFSLNLKVFLEGPYNISTNLMATDLATASLLPLNQPFNPSLPYYGNNSPKWLYNGTQTVTSFPTGTVDYILIELRDAANAAAATSATKIAQVPALLKSDGSIVTLNGTLPSFTNTINNSLFIVIWSRNHLGIMNAAGIAPSGTVVYDFSTGSDKVYGGATGYKLLETGVWGMATGDINADGSINTTDKSPSGWKIDAGKKGYLGSDLNMNIQVTNRDKNEYLYPNILKTTGVPN